MAGTAVSVLVRVPESQATSFCFFNKLAQSFTERSRQLIGNFDSNTNLPEFNRANVGAVNSGPLSKVLL